jgi:hypothetical protein
MGEHDERSIRSRRAGLIIACLVLILGLVGWFDLRSGDADPHLTAAQLAGMADDQLIERTYGDLLLRALRNDGDPRNWKRFKEPARHAWSLGLLESTVKHGRGVAEYLDAGARGDWPGLAEARAACEAMGLSEPLRMLIQAGAIPSGGTSPARSGSSASKATHPADPYADLNAALLAALQGPDCTKARADYIRSHLADIANP